MVKKDIIVVTSPPEPGATDIGEGEGIFIIRYDGKVAVPRSSWGKVFDLFVMGIFLPFYLFDKLCKWLWGEEVPSNYISEGVPGNPEVVCRSPGDEACSTLGWRRCDCIESGTEDCESWVREREQEQHWETQRLNRELEQRDKVGGQNDD